MKSMTGFGYADGESAGVYLCVEVKSLNSRYLDILISLPSSLSVLENRIRENLKDSFLRGRVELNVRVREIESSLSISVDEVLAEKWKSALEKLTGILGGDGTIPLEVLMNQDGVLKVAQNGDTESYWRLLEPLLERAVAQVHSDREREGLQLAEDIEGQLTVISDSLKEVGIRAPQIKAEVEETLRSQFREVMGNMVNELRVLSETASWLARIDINEEIFRLETHIRAFREEAASSDATGKKLDFLAQEMGREINTIGSKTPRVDVSRYVVNMKDALEKIREQLRNVE